jgi:ADP-heptose:LPS heptosyltransferase
MRILISNPDSLGDFLLRQPLIAALAAEGQTLTLVVRDFVAPLAALALPAIPILHCPGDPYEANFSLDTPAGAHLLEKILQFQPELLVAASYQYTRLEEALALSLPGLPTAAMNGHLYPGELGEAGPREPRVQLQTRVEVSASTHEFRKNELFASALLGHTVTLPPPALRPTDQILRQARSLLGILGLEPGGYWVVCAGDASHNRVRNWDVPNWTAFLSAALEQTPATFVFTGTPAESETVEQIRAGLGPLACRTFNLAAEPSGLDILIGLTHFAAGYLGRDTGPMHIAAALERPVLAIFGGGTWPRFVPLARAGAAITVSVPCSGCHWICHLSSSLCVKTIPVTEVLDRFLRLHSGERPSFEVVEIPPSQPLLHQIGRESRIRFVDTVRYFAQTIEELRANPPYPDLSPELTSLRAELSQQTTTLQSRILDLEAALAAQEKHAETLARLIPVLRDEIEQLTFPPTPPAPPLSPLQQLLRRFGLKS